jgi:alkylation response protein AidB-like acyl-CoA dehydrogenase
LLLARTDPSTRAHAGLTMLVLDMAAPGIDVRPLREMTGGAHFNEVVLDDVHVPADCVIGAVGDGWRVAMSTLGSERGRVRQRGRPRWQRVAAARSGAMQDRVARDEIARLAVAETVAQWTTDRVDADAAAGRVGPGGSVLKLAASRVEQRAANLAIGLRGAAAMAWDDDADGRLVHWFLGSRANSIASGTDQIQLNIIAERVLGLPREPR